ncbi:IS66 family insertion sequence element accessory protein TnpB [Enterobacter hormaechei subsp. xiangfangensis]|uniref:IS66 family insertion sequence element accessory protein TnpB n=1 Tax=Enterobacter hormaechei TaxID=158836 RepID=UPI0013D7EE4F
MNIPQSIKLCAGHEHHRNGEAVTLALKGRYVHENPFSGHLFIFRGRKGDTVKILWADADGLCLFTKRLEEGQFIWPAVRDGKIAITRTQLAMLLDKLDWRQPKTTRLNSLTML